MHFSYLDITKSSLKTVFYHHPYSWRISSKNVGRLRSSNSNYVVINLGLSFLNSTWLVLEKKISGRIEVFWIILIISFDIINAFEICWDICSQFIFNKGFIILAVLTNVPVVVWKTLHMCLVYLLSATQALCC